MKKEERESNVDLLRQSNVTSEVSDQSGSKQISHHYQQIDIYPGHVLR